MNLTITCIECKGKPATWAVEDKQGKIYCWCDECKVKHKPSEDKTDIEVIKKILNRR